MTSAEIFKDVKAIFLERWTTRAARVIPDAGDVQLGNDGVSLTGTVLYADMVDSTGLVNRFKQNFAAEIFKAYLLGSCRVIKNNGGEITAFDGDRVMAVFVGDRKNTCAARAALQLHFVVRRINIMLREAYPTTAYTLRHTVGVDVSDLFCARTGIRASNDLVWVGRAANYAAKLCALGEADYPAYITEAVFVKLAPESKFGGAQRKPMWEKRLWTERGVNVYRSGWWWEF